MLPKVLTVLEGCFTQRCRESPASQLCATLCHPEHQCLTEQVSTPHGVPVQTFPTAFACSLPFPGLSHKVGNNIWNRHDDIFSGFVCPDFPLQKFSHKWNLVIREKRNYTVGTQPICLEGLKSGQNHLNALVACFAWESGRKTILPYLPWLFGAVLASLHFCFVTWARPATFFIFSFWNPCRSFIPESLSLCLSHFPHVCVHTHIRRITSMLNGLKEWGMASLFLFFFSPSNLPEKLTILVSWLPSALSWRSLVNGSFSCFDEIFMLQVYLFIYLWYWINSTL